MFNLLPKTDKEAIRKEYRLRLLTVVFWFLCASFIISSLLLIPSFVLSVQKEKITASRFDSLRNSIKNQETEGLESALKSATDKSGLLQAQSPAVYDYELIDGIVSAKPAGIFVKDISFVSSSETRQVDIKGKARDRETLTVFAKALEGLKSLKKVELPISNFAKDADIDFSITIFANI